MGPVGPVGRPDFLGRGERGGGGGWGEVGNDLKAVLGERDPQKKESKKTDAGEEKGNGKNPPAREQGSGTETWSSVG